jgi:hypothetical protein
MIRVKLLQDPAGHKWPLNRQSFKGSGIARGYHFDESHENYDLLLTFGEQSLAQQIKETPVPRERRFCILMENPRFYFVDQAYLALHKFVISPFQIELPEGVVLIQTHPAVPWFYDINFDTTIGLTHAIVNHDRQKNLEFYCEELINPKTKLVSMITSTKGMSEGHKLRVALAVNLKNFLKDNIDLYGFGHQPIANKRQALEDYKFSIIVENDLSDYFMTEKLCDAILGGTTPIYIGASKVREFYESDINYINPVGKSLEEMINSIVLFMNTEQSESNKISQKHETLFRSNFYYHLTSMFMKFL